MNNKKMLKKIIILLCLFAFTFTFVSPISVQAENSDNASKDSNVQSDKAEVVYASLDSTGKTKDVYIVNNFPADTEKNIVDYGDYTEVEDLALSGTASFSGDEVQIQKVEENFYYKGKMKSQELPWLFEIHYLLNGNDVSVAELSQAEGEVEIKLHVSPNPEMPGDNVWAKSLMLQITMTLPNEVAQNITTENGMIAEAGSNKVITFMMIPSKDTASKGDTFTVKADVKNFHMPSIQIAASPFSLDMFQFDLPNLEENEELKKFQEATEQLADGANALSDGINQLNDGKKQLTDNLELITKSGAELEQGGAALEDGIAQYIAGVNQISANNQELLSGADLIKQSADQILGGFQQLAKGNELLSGSEEISKGLAAMRQGASSLSSDQIAEIKAQLAALPDQVAGFQAQMNELVSGLGQINTNLTEIITGLKGLNAALARASILGATQITEEQITTNIEAQAILGYVENVRLQSLPQLIGGLEQISQGIAGIQNSPALSEMESSLSGLSQLSQIAGLFDLLSGIDQLNSKYSMFHSGLYDYVNGFNQLSRGFYNENPQSQSFYGGLTSYLDGVKQYVGGVSVLSNNGSTLQGGLSEYVEGTSAYASGVKQWADGFNAFADGIDGVDKGSSELADGTTQLHEGTADMDKMMNQMMNEFLSGYDADESIPSFASAKNEDPDIVQFVIMSEAIHEAKTETEVQEEAEPDTFWDRLFNLF